MRISRTYFLLFPFLVLGPFSIFDVNIVLLVKSVTREEDGTTLTPVSPSTYRLCSLKFVLRPSSHLRSPDVCILDAVLTVSPNKQYRGILLPTTPATHGPRKANVHIRDQKGINK